MKTYTLQEVIKFTAPYMIHVEIYDYDLKQDRHEEHFFFTKYDMHEAMANLESTGHTPTHGANPYTTIIRS